MTTVVFDGVTLAADSQSNSHQSGKPHTCPHCVGELDVTHSHAEKITVPSRPVMFKRQKVVAWGAAGTLKAMQALGDALLNGIPLPTAHAMIKKAAGQLGCSFLIVTEDSCWNVVSNGEGVKVNEVTEFPVALGSGTPAALFAGKYLGWTAFGAVGAALYSDKFTGGSIHSYVCRPPEGEALADKVSIHSWSEEELRATIAE